MAAKIVRTFKEAAAWARLYATPPTVDDVTILTDGTRIDTSVKARAWLDSVRPEGACDLDA